VEQRALDQRSGRDIGFFVSGYQGSPLGGVDKMLLGMPDVLRENAIHFQPGLNEELAATSVWGSQIELPGGFTGRDGVVGVWYGKGPGVDRATDALRHMAMYGVHPRGGVVLLVGDDPAAKSSTVPAVSERSLAALGIPVLLPRNAEEVVTFGLHAVALSRACGTPVALKIVADVADGAWVIDDTVSQVEPVTPTLVWDDKPWTYTQSPPVVGSARVVAVEAEFVGPRAAMVQAYAAANDVNVVRLMPPKPRLGLVATGPAYDSLAQALLDVGADDAVLADHGVAALRIGLIHPLDEAAVIDFARCLEEVFVVEDKTSFLESQVRHALYDLPDAERPKVVGKKDRLGNPLVPADGELTPGRLIGPLRRVLGDWVPIDAAHPERPSLPLLPISRTPYFCSGCPHNRSTAVPEGSIAGGGIGCHTLVTLSRRTDSAVTGFTQMGGEGAQWIGQAPFTGTDHIFQNLGDGTFFHSGQLAVQACVSAGVNITFKLLHNDVVAMTGAQDAEGARGIPEITHKLAAEGVTKIVVVADEPGRHRKADLADGTLLWSRERLDEAQRLLRDTPGVTVLIYDQHCANDARRQRKRGTMPTRTTRIVINEDVCEGCGDCGVKSNCLSVQPLLTEFGEKTRIDQTSCNTDYSCLEGDCPAFMTVEVDPQAKRAKAALPTPPSVPEPTWRVPAGTQSVFLTGVGGTGIVTVNQVLATAALRAGYAVELLDQIGLAQKAGPVMGHLRFAADGPLDPSNRVTPGHADAILAFDLLTAADSGNLRYGSPAHTLAVASTSVTPTGPEVYERSLAQTSIAEQLDRLRTATREIHELDMLAASEALLGSTTAANLMLVGAAIQCGALKLPPSAVEEAIDINGGRGRREQGRPGVGPALRRRPGRLRRGGRRRHPGAGAGRRRRPDQRGGGAGRGLLRRGGPSPGRAARRRARRVRRPAVRRGLRHDRRRGLAGRAARDRPDRAVGGGRPAPLQADGLQGRVRSRPAAHPPSSSRARAGCRAGWHRPHLQAPPADAARHRDGQEDRTHRLDPGRPQGPGPDEEAPRHGARPLRSRPRAQGRAGAAAALPRDVARARERAHRAELRPGRRLRRAAGRRAWV
jgi:indolepyruvate ferredoxin oxidoreductase